MAAIARIRDEETDDHLSPLLVVRCLCLLAICRVSLRLVGLGRTLKAARRIEPARCTVPLHADAIVATEAAHLIAAAALFPGRARCLEQSVTLCFLLRRRGLPARLRLGVQLYRPGAHAWVELDGKPINERTEVLQQVSVLPDLIL